MPRTLALLLVLALAAPACKSKSVDCSAVGNRVVALIRAELEREPDNEERQRRESMLPALKIELEGKCKAEKWNEAARACMEGASSLAELEKCDPDRSKAGKAPEPEPEPEPEPDPDEPPDLPEPKSPDSPDPKE